VVSLIEVVGNIGGFLEFFNTLFFFFLSRYYEKMLKMLQVRENFRIPQSNKRVSRHRVQDNSEQ